MLRYAKYSALVALLSVGAWGQTAKPKIFAFHNCEWAEGSVNNGVETGRGYKCDEGTVMLGLNIQPVLTLGGLSHDNQAQTVLTLKPEPEDVPAIQHITKTRTPCVDESLDYGPMGEKESERLSKMQPCPQLPTRTVMWTCADKSRTLLSSEDGKTHYCHKAQLESK